MIRTIPTLAFLFICICLYAQEKKEDSKPVPEPKEFVTSHQLTINGKPFRYKVIAGETYLKKDGEPVASIWSFTYKPDGPEVPGRPVTFIFNGGPGSASVWLHMGMFGPVLAKVDSQAKTDDGAPPYPLMPNNQSLLDITDLVFIDPVGTGFSRVIGKGKTEDYWGLNEDAHSVAEFIRTWVTKNKRWNSPRYIAGESFGTVRAVAVTDILERDGQSMAVNGLILISQCLDYAGSTSVPENLISYITYLPSMAATAWYHGKAGQGKTLAQFMEEARTFVQQEYVGALHMGTRLPADQRQKLVERLSYFLGLPKSYIERSDLKILMPRFRKELLRDQGLTVGQLDGRYTAAESDQIADRPTLGDAAGFSTGSAYTAAINHYMSTELNVVMDRPYLTSNSELGNKWRWRDVPDNSYYEPSYVNVADKMGTSMRVNKDLRVLIASGYYDLITPFYDAEFTFSRFGILPERVTMTYHEAGHMMYLHEADFAKLNSEIRQFLTRQTKN